MLIVQISDTHIAAPGELAYNRVDTAACLERAVAMINSLEPRPTAVLHTGDIAVSGEPIEYEHFQSIAKALEIPLLLMPGNHDNRRHLAEQFPQEALRSDSNGEFLHYTADLGPARLRLIACDSVIEGSVHGGLCESRLNWLADALRESGDLPTIVALHHPPFPSGLTGASAQGLVEGGREFTELLRSRKNVLRVIAGHVHRPITTSVAGTIGFACPTTCYPFGLDTGSARELKITGEPPAFAVHQWFAADDSCAPELLTHIVPIGRWGEPMILRRDGQRVLA